MTRAEKIKDYEDAATELEQESERLQRLALSMRRAAAEYQHQEALERQEVLDV